MYPGPAGPLILEKKPPKGTLITASYSPGKEEAGFKISKWKSATEVA